MALELDNKFLGNKFKALFAAATVSVASVLPFNQATATEPTAETSISQSADWKQPQKIDITTTNSSGFFEASKLSKGCTVIYLFGNKKEYVGYGIAEAKKIQEEVLTNFEQPVIIAYSKRENVNGLGVQVFINESLFVDSRFVNPKTGLIEYNTISKIGHAVGTKAAKENSSVIIASQDLNLN